jgi:hypothetical protein
VTSFEEAFRFYVERTGDIDSKLGHQYDKILDAFRSLDSTLQSEEHLRLLSVAVELPLLENWRLMLADPFREALPWWLDGRLETAARAIEEEIQIPARYLLNAIGESRWFTGRVQFPCGESPAGRTHLVVQLEYKSGSLHAEIRGLRTEHPVSVSLLVRSSHRKSKSPEKKKTIEGPIDKIACIVSCEPIISRDEVCITLHINKVPIPLPVFVFP